MLPTCYGLCHDTTTYLNMSFAAKSVTDWQQVCCAVVMELGKRHDTTDTTDLPAPMVVTDLLRGNWCNGFLPLTLRCAASTLLYRSLATARVDLSYFDNQYTKMRLCKVLYGFELQKSIFTALFSQNFKLSLRQVIRALKVDSRLLHHA